METDTLKSVSMSVATDTTSCAAASGRQPPDAHVGDSGRRTSVVAWPLKNSRASVTELGFASATREDERLGVPSTSRLCRAQGRASGRGTGSYRSAQHEPGMRCVRTDRQSQLAIANRVPLQGLLTHRPCRCECGSEHHFQGQGRCQLSIGRSSLNGIKHSLLPCTGISSSLQAWVIDSHGFTSVGKRERIASHTSLAVARATSASPLIGSSISPR